jgi:hypothetical protein
MPSPQFPAADPPVDGGRLRQRLRRTLSRQPVQRRDVDGGRLEGYGRGVEPERVRNNAGQRRAKHEPRLTEGRSRPAPRACPPRGEPGARVRHAAGQGKGGEQPLRLAGWHPEQGTASELDLETPEEL